MAYSAAAHTERKRSANAPLPKNGRGGRPRSGGYVHKHDLPTREQAAEKYAHGTVARYILARCRCLKCATVHSHAQMAAYDAKHGPWVVQRVGKTYRDVERKCGESGGLLCRHCSVEKKRAGVAKHEFTCSNNPHRLTADASATAREYVVAHRRTGEQNGDTLPTRELAEAACERLNRRDRVKLDSDLVSAKRTSRHLIMLRDSGMGMKSISKAAGVAASVCDRLMRGMIQRTRRGTEAKILAVKADPDRTLGRDIPAARTIAMIDAMVSVGYRKGWIAMQCGSKHPALQIGKGGRAQLRADKVRAVRALFDRLWMTDARLREHVDPEGERLRAEAARDSVAARSSQERLRAALAGWDADEFAVRFSRLRDIGSAA